MKPCQPESNATSSSLPPHETMPKQSESGVSNSGRLYGELGSLVNSGTMTYSRNEAVAPPPLASQILAERSRPMYLGSSMVMQEFLGFQNLIQALKYPVISQRLRCVGYNAKTPPHRVSRQAKHQFPEESAEIDRLIVSTNPQTKADSFIFNSTATREASSVNYATSPNANIANFAHLSPPTTATNVLKAGAPSDIKGTHLEAGGTTVSSTLMAASSKSDPSPTHSTREVTTPIIEKITCQAVSMLKASSDVHFTGSHPSSPKDVSTLKPLDNRCTLSLTKPSRASSILSHEDSNAASSLFLLACQPVQTTPVATRADNASLRACKSAGKGHTARKCNVENCSKSVVQGGLCISHGAKRKLCQFPECTKRVKAAGMCSTHGPARKRCEMDKCSNVAVQGGLCIAHGAKKRLCCQEGCTKKSRATWNHMCKRHYDRSVANISGRHPTAPISPAEIKRSPSLPGPIQKSRGFSE